jgi:hypothetical protein
MRKLILCIAAVVFAISPAFLVAGIIAKTRENRIEAARIMKLPAFSFMTLEQTPFSSSEIKKGPVLLIRFHPECEHCQYEVGEIMKTRIPVSKARVLMVSDAGADEVKKFFSPYDLRSCPSVTVLLDTAAAWGEIFGRDVAPSVYIYDEELVLLKAIYGEVRTETLVRYLDKCEKEQKDK